MGWAESQAVLSIYGGDASYDWTGPRSFSRPKPDAGGVGGGGGGGDDGGGGGGGGGGRGGGGAGGWWDVATLEVSF